MGFDTGTAVPLGTVGELDTLEANGRVVAPGAGVAIATLAAPPAGIYEIEVTTAVGVGAVAADNGNIELRFGATVMGAITSPLTSIRRTLDGVTAVTLNATGIATAAVVYTGSIVATRVG